MIDADLRAMRDLVAEAHDEGAPAPGLGVPWSVLRGLQQLIGCDDITFMEIRACREEHDLAQAIIGGTELQSRRQVGSHVGLPAPEPIEERMFWDTFWELPFVAIPRPPGTGTWWRAATVSTCSRGTGPGSTATA